MKTKWILPLAITLTLLISTAKSNAQEAMLGEIRLFASNFAPRGWAFCEGQLLPISQNTALFSLLGTTYGGDGRTTFALPDLRGRVPVGVGQAPGLNNVRLGEKQGAEPLTISKNPSDDKGKSKTGDTQTIQGQLSIGLHYIICLQGIYPSRN